jgi:hypothetical protein
MISTSSPSAASRTRRVPATMATIFAGEVRVSWPTNCTGGISRDSVW